METKAKMNSIGIPGPNKKQVIKMHCNTACLPAI